MKKGIIITIIFSLALSLDIVVGVLAFYQYSKQFESYWSLAVKASTIEKKIESLDKFVGALEKSNLSGKYNAVFLDTPDNSFDFNLEALKSLQIRLHEIKGMDVSSFQYQTALAQITQQEQNEAKEMLSVFEGVWWKENHTLLWNWIGITNVLITVGLLFTGIFLWIDDNY